MFNPLGGPAAARSCSSGRVDIPLPNGPAGSVCQECGDVHEGQEDDCQGKAAQSVVLDLSWFVQDVSHHSMDHYSLCSLFVIRLFYYCSAFVKSRNPIARAAC